MKINKQGRTYKAYEQMKKIWGGTRLHAFVRSWLGESRSDSLKRWNNKSK